MELAALRKAAGFSGQAIADSLGWDQSRVSRVEKGKQAIDEIDLITWLLACNVKRPQLRGIVAHNLGTVQETWVLPYGPASSDSRNVLAEEREAKTMVSYSCPLVPVLLQTPAYTRALVVQFHEDEAAVERIVAARGDRQEVLRGPDAPDFVFYIEEAALHRPVGGREVLHDQLLHLMFMADWKKITVRVLLTDVGEHAAGDGPFVLIQRRDKRWVACVHTRATSLILEHADHIAAYQSIVEDLATRALAAEESRAFIAALADLYD
jgi:transcriptional regulator with XRE-family HTH domain